MPGIKKILKAPLYRLVDYLATSHYAKEKLWQTGRDLFVQARPGSIERIALAPLPSRYRETLPQVRTGTPKNDPIFITARFRSGSTFLWQLFRNIDGVTCYYEPLNEAEWMTRDSDATQVDTTHIGVDGYRSEYKGLEDLAEFFDPEWAFQQLYMDETHHNPKLEYYISQLIKRTPGGRTVLQFNRVDFRLPWLRAHFPQARILHLYRHPREQWMSIIGKGAAIRPDHRIKPGQIDSLDGFYTLEWARDLRHVFPFLEPAGKHLYELHYLLWRLSYSLGRAYGDLSVCYEDLIGDFERVASEMFDAVGIRHPDIARLAELNHGSQKTRWPDYASDAWFNDMEAQCDHALETFFSDITPAGTGQSPC
ncbi:MAG: sulfotransferase [Thiobacillus sp.]|nr:sulfotransferase [Thiobacillus sp.]